MQYFYCQKIYMKYFISLIALCLASFFSVNAQNVTKAETDAAIAFNDYCAGIVDDLYQAGTAWGAVYAEVAETGNFIKLKGERVKMENIINDYIVALTKLKVPPAYEKFKKASLDLLVYEDSLIKTAFIPFEKLSASSSDAEKEKVLNTLVNISKDEEKYLENFQLIQQAFAKEMNFSLN